MRDLHMVLTAENFTRAEVRSTGHQHVTLMLDQTEHWDAVGLLKLSAMLAGVDGVLTREERP